MGLYVSSGKMAEDEVVILPLCKPGNNPTHVLLFRWWSSGWEEAASKWKIRRFTTVDAQTLQKGEAFKW